MTINSTEDLYVFFHVNKTGGTTLTTHLQNCFQDNPLRTPMLNQYQRELHKDSQRTYWTDLSFEEKMQALIVSGHEANPTNVQDIAPYKSVKYLTFFRDPGSRILSTFNYGRAMGTIKADRDLPEHLAIKGFNITQLRFFAHNFLGYSQAEIDKMTSVETQQEIMAEALETLRDFFFIGLHEFYEHDAALLTDLLKLPSITRSYTVTGRDYPAVAEMTDELDEMIRECFPVEYEFYGKIRDLRITGGTPLLGKEPSFAAMG